MAVTTQTRDRKYVKYENFSLDSRILVQGSSIRRAPGCETAAGKLRQKC